MQGRIIVSGGDRLRVFHSPQLSAGETVPLPRSGALCAGREVVFAASDEDNAIYRLDARTLLPTGVYAGGPGMRALCLSADEERLFALLSDADSVLMLSGRDGAPMMLARVGVQPQSMRFDDTGERLVVAGGKDGCAHLLCAHTLRLLRRFPAEGFCADAVCRKGRVRALRLGGERLFAAPGKLIAANGLLLMIEPLTERLYASTGEKGEWRLICSGARDAAALPDKEEYDRAYSP